MAPAGTHHTIVALESFFVPVPDLELPEPHTYELTEYQRTKPDQVVERIRDADIIIISVLPIKAEVLRPEVTPRLKMIAVVASGVDCVDLEACKARGIVVANTPHCNATSVAEHAIALYFATRRSIPLSNTLTRQGEWPKRGSLMKTLDGPDGKPPRTCRDEVVGIIGYGAVGKRIESIAKSLGMKTMISGRKDALAPDGRTNFGTLLRESSVVILCLPRTSETVDLIKYSELTTMQPYAVLINVSRGGIVNENALVAALKNKKIAGAAADVFSQEPASPDNNPLLGPDTADLNLVTTPHVAWCAEDTNDNYNQALKENLHGWLSTGKPRHHVI
ncbi:glycerate dehydrogenase [Whalleya microplaca]|nr:glycerate dehydrogenase [Whalleya microplaca]